jgi:hypothetical protein
VFADSISHVVCGIVSIVASLPTEQRQQLSSLCHNMMTQLLLPLAVGLLLVLLLLTVACLHHYRQARWQQLRQWWWVDFGVLSLWSLSNEIVQCPGIACDVL